MTARVAQLKRDGIDIIGLSAGERTAARWGGEAYLDSNEGDEPIDRPFTEWDWSRAPLRDGSTVAAFKRYGRFGPHDRAADAQHPHKKHRPLASGALPIAHGLLAAPLPAPDQTSLGVRAFEVPHGALEEALLEFAGSAMVISHDRWFLDRICTHIMACEGDSQWKFFDGNFSEYEADKKKRLGEEGARPKRARFKSLK